MRFLVDECMGPTVARWLRSLQRDVFSVYDEARGLDDESLVQKAHLENYILITADKEFAEIIFRRKKPHKGVILLRLEDERPENKISILQRVLESYSDRLVNNFVIATEKTVRIIGERKDKIAHDDK